MTTVATQSNSSNLLDWLYSKAESGFGTMDSAHELANRYRREYSDTNQAIEALISNETLKAASSGFLSGIGGIVSTTLLLPANLAGVLLIQVRLVMVIAILTGHSVKCDKVKWLILGCLCGDTLAQMFKNVCAKQLINVLNQASLNILTKTIVKYVTAKVLTKSTSSMIKFIPLLGGIIGGAIDYGMTKSVGKTASIMFTQSND